MRLKFSKYVYDFKLKPVSSGSKIRKIHELSLDDKGQQCLAVKEENLYEIIQSYASGCSIERIIISHGLGDELLLNQKPGVYMDESAVNNAKSDKSIYDLNSELGKLWKKTDTELSFEDFSKAVLSGNFEALKPKKKEEVVDNA